MSGPVRDLAPWLERAVQLARDAGITEPANALEARASCAYTTSSEFLGEVGRAIVEFRKQAGSNVPEEVNRLLDDCLREIAKVWA